MRVSATLFGMAYNADENTIKQLREQVRDLRAALSAIQWMAELGHWDEGGCSECHQHDTDGHAEDCVVGKALEMSE